MSLTISGKITEANQLLMDSEPPSQETIFKVVKCIAKYSNPEVDRGHELQLKELEKNLKDKLTDVSVETFQAICTKALISEQKELIKVCKRVASFSQFKIDAIESAKGEATYIPKPPRMMEQLSGSLYPLLRRISKLAGQALHIIYLSGEKLIFILAIPIIYLINDPIAPLVSQADAIKEKGLTKIYKSLFKPLIALTEAYYSLFETTEKAHTVALVILAAAVAIYFIHRKLRLGIPEDLDKKELFQNLTSKVKSEDTIQQVIGRDQEKEDLMLAWEIPTDEKFQFGVLIGPTGVGKTEFVNGLAWESVHDANSFMYGKTIYSINTILLAEQRSPSNYFRSKILPSLEGHEDHVVLFFDEAHSAGEKKGGIGPLLEFFKTEILARNIRCLLGTTTEEYKTFIRSNKAFVDRSEVIAFSPLSDEDMIEIIQIKVMHDANRKFEFEPDAYPAMMTVSANHPEYKSRSNPRKTIDLYKKITGYFTSWKPKALKRRLKKHTQKVNNIIQECIANNNRDYKWSNSPDGQKATQNLRVEKTAEKALKEKIEKQKQQFKAIVRNQKLVSVYRNEYYEAVHIVADQTKLPTQETQHHYLFVKCVLIPALQAALLQQAQKFKTDFPEEEEIPLKIDAALIQRQYPPEKIKKTNEINGDNPNPPTQAEL